jgi:hypothetical protein
VIVLTGQVLRFGKQRTHHYQSCNELKHAELAQAKQRVAPKIVVLENESQ